VGNEYRVENKGMYGRIILKWVLANNQLDALIHVPYFPAHKTHFFSPEKCDLNSTCVLCAEGKYYFQIYSYKYPYIYYTTSVSWDSENNHENDFSGSDDDFLGFYDE